MKLDRFEIETPERVRFRYVPAESAARAGAFLLDLLLQAGLALAVVLLLIGLELFTDPGPFAAFALMTLFVVQWGYGAFFEARTGGRTPGKSAMKIRVVRSDGLPLDLRSVAIRNLLRGADGLPVMILPLLGGFVSMADPLSRRLGDLVAGTVVVKDERHSLVRPDPAVRGFSSRAEPIMPPPGKALDETGLWKLRRFLNSSDALAPARRDAVALELATKLASRLGTGIEGEPLDFILAVYLGHGPVASEEFCRERGGAWSQLEGLLSAAREQGGRVSPASARRFLELFRKACGDLAAARSRGLAPDAVDYLNALVGEARSVVYVSDEGSGSGPLFRAALRAPAAVRRRLPFIAASFLLFALPLALSGIAALNGPGRTAGWTDIRRLERMAEDYSKIGFDGRSFREASDMAAFYISNNVGIVLRTLAGGVFMGLGSAFFLVENGLSIGATLGYVSARGHGQAILRFVTAHSVFELGGLMLAGAAGLLMGWKLLVSGRGSRLEAVRSSMDDFLPMSAMAVGLTFSAAFIEAWLSPSGASQGARLGVAAACAAFLALWYAVALRRDRGVRA